MKARGALDVVGSGMQPRRPMTAMRVCNLGWGVSMREERVFGPPGTGKTTYVASAVQEAAARHGPEGVVVASFTRAAAAELSQRNLPLEKGNVGTLHALAYRELGRGEIAEAHVDEWNREQHGYRLISAATRNLDESEADDTVKTRGDVLYLRYENLRGQRVPPERWPAAVHEFANAWEAWKQRRRYIDFTDMIAHTLEAGGGPPGGAAVGFFDETQDFTPLELALVRQWGARMERVVLAGDDDQCLYDFKGATPDAFLYPPLPASQKRVLARSYRVPRVVHARATDWIGRVQHREPKVYQPRDADGLVRHLRGATSRHPDTLLRELEGHLATEQRIMVLVSCGYMLAPLLRLLRRQAIPYHNPYRRARRAWNPLTSERGPSIADRLLAYLHPDRAVWGEDARWWTAQDVALWAALLRPQGNLKPRALKELQAVKSERPLGYSELRDYLEPAALAAAWDLNLDWLAHAAQPAKRKALAFPLAIVRRRGGRLLRETPRLCVGTIHSVKGGEADTVYLYPDLSRAAMANWLRPGAGRDTIRRQFYVGMTRAKEELVLCGASGPYAVPL
jgi:DNA helicase-2/ATP-dependent DNA helicase PcrA